MEIFIFLLVFRPIIFKIGYVMPTYDYRCLKCKQNFELFQNMSEEPISNCPECAGEVKRLIGAGTGPIFKGKGFYQTDYKNSIEKSDQKDKSKTIPEKTNGGKDAGTSNNSSK
jgi:putative FmdB family regulatory protein